MNTTESARLPDRYFDALASPNPVLSERRVKLVRRLLKISEPSEAQLQKMGSLMMVGDAPADEWARCYTPEARESWYRQFNEALEGGFTSVANPPAELKALLRDVEEEPLWLDRRLLDAAAQTHQRVGLFQELVMKNMALMGGYTAGAMTKPLVFTGALESGTSRRITETANFGLDVTRRGGLERHGPGFKTALRVRMMHGLIRRRILAKPGWRADLWGIPINQADMIMTNVATSYVFFIGLRLLGFRFSDEEVIAYLHLWRYVGYLMGIEDQHLPSTEQEARNLLYLGLKLQAPPDEDSLALAEALTKSPVEEADTWAEKLVAHLQEALESGFSRYSLGKRTADFLKIPDTPWKYWPAAFAVMNFGVETARILTPGATRAAVYLGGLQQQRSVHRRLTGEEAAYVPAIDLAGQSRAAK